jgi:hypothetical protein
MSGEVSICASYRMVCVVRGWSDTRSASLALRAVQRDRCEMLSRSDSTPGSASTSWRNSASRQPPATTPSTREMMHIVPICFRPFFSEDRGPQPPSRRRGKGVRSTGPSAPQPAPLWRRKRMRHATALLVMSRLSMTCLLAAISYAAIRAGLAACPRTLPIGVRLSVAARFQRDGRCRPKG